MAGHCLGCRAELGVGMRACPACNRLVYAQELTLVAQQAGAATQTSEALELWRRALQLLPPETRQYQEISERISSLTREVDDQARAAGKSWWKGPAGLGGVGLLLWKAKTVILLLLGKFKFLALGLTKLNTLGSMVLFFGVYCQAFGWTFALVLVVSIYIHEMGHVAAISRYGIPATAPMFIPGVGARICVRHLNDRREIAVVGLAGPVWGLATALVALILGGLTGNPFWLAAAKLGGFINLFNLMPIQLGVVQLDGFHGWGALCRWQRFLVAACFLIGWMATGDGLTFLILLVAVFCCWTQAGDPDGDKAVCATYCVLALSLSLLTALPVSLRP